LSYASTRVSQFLRPDANVTQTSFTNGFAQIDESTASDADFAYGANNTAAVLEVSLSNPSGTPASGTCTVRYRIAKTNAGTVDGGGNGVDVTGEVYQGGSQIATDTARTTSGSWTEYSFTFAASAVSDWTDLRLRFTTTTSGGSPANRRGGAVSWAEIETPDAASNTQADTDVGALTLVGFAPAVVIGIVVATALGEITLTGYEPTVSVTNHVTVSTDVGALTLTGFAPTVSVAPTITENVYTAAGGSGLLTQLDVTSVVVGAGDRILAFLWTSAANISAMTCTLDPGGLGESIGLLHNDNIGGVDASECASFERLTPSAGTYTVRFAWTTSAFAAATVLVLHGSDTSVAAGNAATATVADNNSPTINISSAAGRVVYCGLTFRDSTTTITADGDGQTRLGEITNASGGSFVRGCVYREAGAATTTVSATLSTSTSTWRMRGYDFQVATGTTASPGVGALTLAGFAPTVTASDHQTVTTGLGQLTLTGYEPAVSGGVTVATDVGALTLTGFAPTVTATANVTVDTGVGQLTLEGFGPTVTASDHQVVATAVGQLTMTGFAPTITAGTSASPATGELTLTGFAPTVSVTLNQTVETATGALTVAGFAPTVTASDHKIAATGVGQLTLSGFAATVTASDHKTASAGVGALTLTGFAPTVTTTANVVAETGVGQLTLEGFAPSIGTSGAAVVETLTGTLLLVGYAPDVVDHPPISVATAVSGAAFTLTPVSGAALTLTPTAAPLLTLEAVSGQPLTLAPSSGAALTLTPTED
jgi:hypothetical protein